MPQLRIIFMGTPEFAVSSLDILVENGYHVVAVITAPDKPAGRGQKINESDVKKAALKHNLPILQPTNLKDESFLEELRSYNANLQVVVAFRMLPEVVWQMPEIGTFNLHASLLPNYRGAAPINWAIINGEEKTGVTTFFLQHKIDTGDILFQEEEEIYDNDNVGTLYERLKNKGARLVLKTVKAIQDNDYAVKKQNLEEKTPHAPKIFTEDTFINFNNESEKILNFVRGLTPYPAARMRLYDTMYKVFDVEIADYDESNELLIGEPLTDQKSYLYVKTLDGYIKINELQPEGKRRMKTDEFLRGNKI
ncbi:MAG: methionyl-tRNA formyltransferase [Flexibacter sp. CG_4_10_14_3_um_filter_32_15]|nr:MAG: methionyl-tRNA formyltransferase [Flexibacter sp. CG_4_10_14_3_um_filter_32_15]